MKTKKDYTVNFMHFGKVTVPQGTKLTHKTAMGIDRTYHFVDEFDWIDKNYPDYAPILKDEVSGRGINVPKEFVDYESDK